MTPADEVPAPSVRTLPGRTVAGPPAVRPLPPGTRKSAGLDEPPAPISRSAGRAFGLLLFVLLFGSAAVLPWRLNWVHVWGEWPVLELSLVAIPVLLLAVRPWRSRLLRARNGIALLALAALAAGLWAAPRSPMTDRTFVHLALIVVAGYLCARLVAGERSLWRPLALVIAVIAGLVALGGLLEVVTGTNPLYEASADNPYYAMYRAERRAISTQFNPAPLGSFLVMAWPFAAWLGASHERRFRLPGLAALALIVPATLLTYSRGALLGLVLSVALALLLARRQRQLLALAGLAAIVVLLASHLPYPFNKYGSQGFLEGGGVTSVKRLSRLEMTGAILADRPLTGLGFHGSRNEFDRYYPPQRPSWGKGGRVLDNAYLTVLAETGLLGSMALAAFLFVELARGALAWRRSRGGFLGAGLTGACGILVTAAGYDLVYWSGPAMFCVLVLGLVSGAADAAEPDAIGGLRRAARDVTGRAAAGAS